MNQIVKYLIRHHLDELISCGRLVGVPESRWVIPPLEFHHLKTDPQGAAVVLSEKNVFVKSVKFKPSYPLLAAHQVRPD